MVYCSGLRELDAVLGNDEKFIRNICEAAKEMHPNFIALVGSPVPMVIGTDTRRNGSMDAEGVRRGFQHLAFRRLDWGYILPGRFWPGKRC